MNVIACVDNAGGIGFNHRRQSMDSAVRDRILSITKGSRLWMNHYSAGQFDLSMAPQINADENFLSEAAAGEFCFVEIQPIGPYANWVEHVIIFRWNRDYPADTFFDIDVTGSNWNLCHQEEFQGNSHDRITMEVYRR